MPMPEFIKCRCGNTDDPRCALCPREFILPITAIEGIYKSDSGKAIFLINTIHYISHPMCGNMYRMIESTMTYDSIVSLLNGKIVELGDVTMKTYDLISKG